MSAPSCEGLERTDCTGSKKKCDERKDHFVAKVLVEKEHAQHNPYGNDAQNGHGPLDEL